MFNAGRLRFHLMSVIVTSAIAASVGSSSMAGEPQETVIVRRQAGHTIQILHSDGTTTKIPPTGQFLHVSPDGVKLVTAAQAAAEAEKENAKRSPSTTGEPQDTVANQRGPEQTIENIYGDGRRETVRVGAKRSSGITGDAQEIAVVRRLTDQAIEIIYADGTKETITIQRNLADQTTAILNVDGTTTKLPPGSRTSPASSKHESVAEKAAEAENQNATPPSNAGPPAGRPITPLSQSAQRHQPQPRFQVSAAGDSAVLLDTVSGRTWLLYYPDKKILSRLNEERGRTWKEMPCIWLPLHRPEVHAEIEQILARERSLREASDKLRAEEQRKRGATSQELLEKLKAEWAEQRKRAAGSDGTRRNADGTPQEPKPE